MPAELQPGAAEHEVSRDVRGRPGVGRGRGLLGELELTAAPRAAADHAERVRGGVTEPLEAALRAGDLCLLGANHTPTIGTVPDGAHRTYVQFWPVRSDGAADELRAPVGPGALGLELRAYGEQELLADGRPHELDRRRQPVVAL